MNTINILDKDSIAQYSYTISNSKISDELQYYRQCYDHKNLLNSDNLRLPNFEKYQDINFTDFSNFHLLGKIVLQKNFQTSFGNVVKLKDFLASSKDPENLYPIAVRYISSNGTYYIERPPFQIEVTSTFSGKTFPPLKIWVPWTILAFTPKDPSNYYLYFSHKSLSSMDDKYFPCFLPNIYDNGRICMGSSLNKIPLDSASINNIKLMYSNIINEYMSGGWNTDLSPKHNYYLSYNLQQLTQDKYPTLYAFNNPTIDYIKAHYPKMRNSTITKLINPQSSNRYRNTYFLAYKYYFFMMNTFDLETTLNFYSELSDYLSSSKNNPLYHQSFQAITEMFSTNYNFDTPYNISSNISSSLSRYLLFKNPSENIYTSETKNIYFIYPFLQKSINHTSHNYFFKKELIHELVSKSLLSPDDKKVFHLNQSREQIEQEVLLDPSVKVAQYYIDYLRSINLKDINV